MSNEVWEEIYDRVAALVRDRRTTLVFVNTRRLAERVARHLGERLGPDAVAAHHGSLARAQRQDAEARLKAGRLKVLVATASLELGIDIGTVDLVCQIGAPRTISALLQRVGRARHQVGGTPEGRLFPLSRDDLVVAAALVDAARRGEVDRLLPPTAPLDILAQQVVAQVSGEEARAGGAPGAGALGVALPRPGRGRPRRGPEDARRGVRDPARAAGGAAPPRPGARAAAAPAGGEARRRGERRRHPRHRRLRRHPRALRRAPRLGERGLRRGEPRRRRLPARQRRLADPPDRDGPGAGRRRRRPAPEHPLLDRRGAGRTRRLTDAVSRVRSEVAARVVGGGVEAASAWLTGELGLPEAAATQLAEYLAAGMAALGAMPTTGTLVLERFFDQVGDMHLVLHAPLGSRLNRALGLSLRKRFCQRFNFELQAAATDDAVLLCSGPPTASRWPTSSATSTRGPSGRCWSRRSSTRRCSGSAGGGTPPGPWRCRGASGASGWRPRSSGCRPRTSSRWSSRTSSPAWRTSSCGARSRTTRWSTRPCATASPRSWTSTGSSSSSGTWPPGSWSWWRGTSRRPRPSPPRSSSPGPTPTSTTPRPRSGGPRRSPAGASPIRRTSPSSGPWTPGPSTGSAPTPGPCSAGPQTSSTTP